MNRQYSSANNQMLFTDRGGVFKRNLESQGTLPAKENPNGFNTKPLSPTDRGAAGSIQRPMKD